MGSGGQSMPGQKLCKQSIQSTYPQPTSGVPGSKHHASGEASQSRIPTNYLGMRYTVKLCASCFGVSSRKIREATQPRRHPILGNGTLLPDPFPMGPWLTSSFEPYPLRTHEIDRNFPRFIGPILERLWRIDSGLHGSISTRAISECGTSRA